MVFGFFKRMFRIVLRIFYRRAFVTGLENFPKNKPVILAVNHPNSFLDAIIASVFTTKPLYFLARGDVFKNKVISAVLNSMHLIPIYRRLESRNNHEKNQATFERCHKMLGKNKAILIFPEGICTTNKRLRTPFRKGIARIAFGTLDSFPEKDVIILPVGVNYTRYSRFRSEIMVDIGPGISAKDYYDLYKKDPGKALYDLTQDTEKGMRNTLVVLDDLKKSNFAEQWLDFYRSLKEYHPLPWKKKDRSRLEDEQRICNTLNARDSSSLEHIESKMNRFFREMKEFGLKPMIFNQSTRFNFVFGFLLITTLPFYLIGKIYRILPDTLALSITKSKVRGPEFFCSVWICLGLLFHLIWLGLLLGFGSGYELYSYLGIPLVLVSALISVYYEAWCNRLMRSLKWMKFKKHPKFRGILEQYEEIQDHLEELDHQKITLSA